MIELPDDIPSLKATVIRLYDENEKLKAEIVELRRRLGLDSTNSHKPPSSDGYKKKTITPAIPREKHSKGGQAGHKGNALKRVTNPDKIILHLPTKCQCCGREFTETDQHEVIQNRQVFDLPQPKLEVTEHQIGEICCCGLKQRGEFPQNVTATTQYGPGVRALVVNLSVDYKMPIEQISNLFNDLYGYDLNSSTVLEALDQAYEKAMPLEEANKQEILAAPHVHFDETGIRVNGKLYWLHTASTETSTHLFVHEKRGQEALQSEASVIKDYSGTAVHDCWKPYFQFDKPHHVLCGAHILRELNSLIEDGKQWAAEMHGFLLRLLAIADVPELAAALRSNCATDIRSHYESILQQANLEEPHPDYSKRKRPKQSPGRNLLDRLRLYGDGVLAFALEDGVPFTNNQAERDLRGAKVKQKVSGCFRTVAGAVVYARVQGIVLTFRKRGEGVLAKLRELFV